MWDVLKSSSFLSLLFVAPEIFAQAIQWNQHIIIICEKRGVADCLCLSNFISKGVFLWN